MNGAASSLPREEAAFFLVPECHPDRLGSSSGTDLVLATIAGNQLSVHQAPNDRVNTLRITWESLS